MMSGFPFYFRMMALFKKRFFHFFTKPIPLSIFNGIVLLIAIFGNTQLQAFCVPVDWAIIVLVVCFLNTTFYPILLERKKLIPWVSFINGISFNVFLYCILFLGHMNFLGILGILYFGIGLLVYIPHFLQIQIFWKGFTRLSSPLGRKLFGLGISLSLLIGIISVWKFNQALADIENFKKSGYTELKKTYMTERILGIGIIYHTEFCEFDGWRPPKHDPLLNLGLMLNGRNYPLNISLENRVKYYREFFPDRKVKFECSCASEESQRYHEDKLWK